MTLMDGAGRNNGGGNNRGAAAVLDEALAVVTEATTGLMPPDGWRGSLYLDETYVGLMRARFDALGVRANTLYPAESVVLDTHRLRGVIPDLPPTWCIDWRFTPFVWRYGPQGAYRVTVFFARGTAAPHPDGLSLRHAAFIVRPSQVRDDALWPAPGRL